MATAASPTNGDDSILQTSPMPLINGKDHHEESSPKKTSMSPRPDPEDPQQLVIASLRSQVSDLFQQVTQLNNKLVQSYDRVSNLEDDLHVANASLRNSTLHISQLEIERTQHLSALNTGLLVEKEQVTAELTRVMEKAMEEAARRGQAESDRAAIEKELDDLSANLFSQANSMVAEARFKEALSEQKVGNAELALKGAEEALNGMQLQMQQLREDKEKSDTELVRLNELMGKGNSHQPYQEFLLFLAHLRTISASSTQQRPALPSLTSLPFLARLHSEDIDPTLRLDMAPSLNWLSRRSIIAAIHTGQFTIEPMPSHTLAMDGIVSSPRLSGSHTSLTCALCGVPVLPSSAAPAGGASNLLGRAAVSRQIPWSVSLFKSPSTMSPTPSPPTQGERPIDGSDHHTHQIYVFRFPSTPAGSISQNTPMKMTTYPLCPSGWCLLRLRSTCSLLAYIRASLIDRIWEEESRARPGSIEKSTLERDKGKPPLPPRRASERMGGMTMGNLWGLASGALTSSKSISETEDSGKGSPTSTTPIPSQASRPLPPPPPRHPDEKPNAKPPASSPASAAPPPLPPRSVGRVRPTSTYEPSQSQPHSVEPTDTSSPTDGDGRVESLRPPAPSLLRAVSSTTSEGGTQDGFTTPPEEMIEPPEDIKVPLSPASIPLPESRPASPALTVRAQAGSPVPPPLPRRAARRAVPQPGHVVDLATVPSRTATPTAELRPSTPENAHAAQPPALPVRDIPATTDEHAVNDASAEAPPDPSHDEDKKQPESPSAVLSKPIPRLPPRNRPLSATPIEAVQPTNEDPEQKQEDVEGGISFNGPFVGEDNWEERSWREIVKLREDMFWARIGSLRSS